MRAAITAFLLALAALSSAVPAWAQPVPAALQALDKKLEATKQSMMGDPSAAKAAAEDALRAARALQGDATLSAKQRAIALASAQWLLGEAYIGLNDGQRSASLFAQALAGVEQWDRGSKLNGDLLRSRATVREIEGNVQGALGDYLAAYEIFRQIGQKRSQAIALQDIGGLYLEAGDFDRVRKYYSESHEAFSEDPWLNLATFNNRGQAYRLEGRFAEAEREYALALGAARQLGSPLLEARILTNLADAQVQLGQLGKAAATLDQANARVQRGEGAGWRQFVLGVRAMLEEKRGNMAEAARLMSAVFAGMDLGKTEIPFKELHQAAARIYERTGDKDLSLAHLKAFNRLESEGLHLTASAAAQLMAAQFDFANQNLRIAQLRQGQLERDVKIERQRSQFRTRLFAALGSALLVIFALLGFGYVSIRRSRDQVRATNAELSTTNVALEQALKARTDFLAMTSHEIRTPLNGILGMAQVLLADRGLARDTRERVELLHGAGETMKVLVDDLLDMAKMDASRIEVALSDTDLAALLDECAGLWREAAAGKGLAFDYALADVPARIETDGPRLKQVLQNLLSNAVKFTAEGTVGLEVRRQGDTLRFAVHDSGVGIAEADRERIFEAFTQANNSTTREYAGTGLGLAISRKLAEALGGTLALESEEGAGSRFTLTLPLRGAASEPIAAPGRRGLKDSAVLVVERNVASHALLRILLTPETRAVEIAVSLDEAARRFAEERFDLLLIEGASARREGEPTLAGLREGVSLARLNGASAVLLAAPSEELPVSELALAGADRVILKPVGGAELIAQLRDLAPAPGQASPHAAPAVAA